jgi:hypothetical protein
VEIEGVWLAHELHAGFIGQLISLAPVAGMAAGYEVFPRGRAAAGTRDYVVQRQIARRERLAAILASVAIAQQNVFA